MLYLEICWHTFHHHFEGNGFDIVNVEATIVEYTENNTKNVIGWNTQ